MRVLLAIMLVSHVAAAAPLARTDVDVGTKRVRITVEPTGALAADGATVVTLAPAITAAVVEAGQVLGTPTIVATITSAAGQEAVVLENRGTWKQVLRQPVGGVGADADYAVVIGLAPTGIYRYQTRPGFHRCDGHPAYFFAESWDGAKFQRLEKLPTEIDAGAKVIAAHADASPAPVPLLYQARIASYEPRADDIGALGIPADLDDGKPTTGWSEDLAHSSGEGQFFTFEPRSSLPATQLRFVAAGRGYNRPKRIGLVGATSAYHVEFPDAAPASAYVVDLPAPIAGCVTAVLESTYGPEPGKTAIAELEVFADGERTGGAEPALAALIASGGDGLRIAEQALARRGAPAVAAIVDKLAHADDPASRRRLVRALVAINDPSAGPPLARAVAELRLRDDDAAAALAALGALGQVDLLAQLADNHDLDDDARVAAIAAIAHAPGDHAALLVPLAGKGSPAIRRALIDALTNVPIAELAPAAEAAPIAATAGDLWRAATRRGHAVGDERAPAVAAMMGALPAVTDYERRYRLVDGLAVLGDAAALQAIAALLHQLPAGAEHAAIAQVAAHGIATAPRPDARVLVVALASDPDPGVRIAALSALDDATDTDHVLEAALDSDTWPEVRRHAAQRLGNRCARPEPARALALSVGRDPDVAVREDSLEALVACKAPGTAALLVIVWDDAKLPPDLRTAAVKAAARLDDPALGAKLVERLARWRGAALESADALALAQAAAYAIGQLRPSGAADALLAALADDAYPEIVAAAASGLGLLGPACPPAAKAQLRVLAHNQDQQIALAAGHAVGLCGR